MSPSAVREASPEEAWAALEADGTAVLIDVRTTAEWSFVGLTDLSACGREPLLIEWQSYPSMGVNPGFARDAVAAMEGARARSAFFICRSGVRSLHAAHAVASAAPEAGYDCVNVAGGFEGDVGPDGRRGAVNGWKAAGLPWRQS